MTGVADHNKISSSQSIKTKNNKRKIKLLNLDEMNSDKDLVLFLLHLVSALRMPLVCFSFRPFCLSRKKDQKRQGKKMLLAHMPPLARFFALLARWM